jgi:hypothetical protein
VNRVQHLPGRITDLHVDSGTDASLAHAGQARRGGA